MNAPFLTILLKISFASFAVIDKYLLEDKLSYDIILIILIGLFLTILWKRSFDLIDKYLLEDKLKPIDIILISALFLTIIGSIFAGGYFGIISEHEYSAVRVDIEPIKEVNVSDYFAVNAKIKNTGHLTAFQIVARIEYNEDGNITLVDKEMKAKIFDKLDKNSEETISWWLNSSSAGYKVVRVNVSSKNAGNDSEITVIKVKSAEVKATNTSISQST